MGWGTSSWGTSSWGTVSGALSISSIYAVSEREVWVDLSATPLVKSSIGNGDALNPATWLVRTAIETFTVLAAMQVGSTAVRLYLLEKLSSPLIAHEAGSTTLRSASGALIVSPFFGSFSGCVAVQRTPTTVGTLDFENPPFDTNRPAGTLFTGTDGDYRLHSGNPFLRKMVMRHLTTLPGGFLHLDNFGLGLRVKEPLGSSDLTVLRSEISRELLKEPEFIDVNSRLQLFADGRLQMEIRVKLGPNQEVVIPLEATPL